MVLNVAKKIKKELLSSTKRGTIFDIIRARFMVSRATFFDKSAIFILSSMTEWRRSCWTARNGMIHEQVQTRYVSWY